jgi:glycosyltransferase involved in cell wall biosynthesis
MSTYNQKLAIAIPTYNRAEILEENLLLMLPDLKRHSIPVYISDDSSDCKTEEAINKLQLQYEHIYYRHNQQRFGHDENFFATLAMPDTDYVWYMGDAHYFKSDFICEILEVLDEAMDFCFINAIVEDHVSRHVDNIHDFLVDRTWYLTLTGATIYGRKPRSLMVDDKKKKAWCNFVQLGLILEYCSQSTALVYWYGKPAIGSNEKKKSSYWSKNVFDVFVVDWVRLIRSFDYLFSESEQIAIIKSSSINTGLFSFKNLLSIRKNRAINLTLLRKHKLNFAIATSISPLWAYVISLIPISMVSLLFICVKTSKKLLSKQSTNE